MILLPNIFKLAFIDVKLYGGGSGGGGAPTTETVNQSTMPAYLQPEVEGLLGNATQQIFNTTPNADGSFNVGSTQPYVAYGSNIQYGSNGKPVVGANGQLQYLDANGNPLKGPNATNIGAQNAASAAVAGFTPLQQQAQQGTANMQTPGQFGQAMGMTGMEANQSWSNPNTAQQFMNPYMQQVMAPQMALLQQQQGQQQAVNQGQATQAGAFGGSRMGVQNALQNQSNQLAMSNLTGQALNNAYNTGMGQFNTQQANTLQAANQLGSLAGQQQGAQLNVLNAQNTVGGQQQQQQQNIVNQAISNYAQQQQYPEQQLNEYSSLLHGYAIPGQATTTYQAPPSAVSIASGLGTAAVGMSKLGSKKGGIIKAKNNGIATLAIRNALRKKA